MTSVLCIAPYEEIGPLGDLPGPDGIILLDGQLVNFEADLRDGVLKKKKKKTEEREDREDRKEMEDDRGFRRVYGFINNILNLPREEVAKEDFQNHCGD